MSNDKTTSKSADTTPATAGGALDGGRAFAFWVVFGDAQGLCTDDVAKLADLLRTQECKRKRRHSQRKGANTDDSDRLFADGLAWPRSKDDNNGLINNPNDDIELLVNSLYGICTTTTYNTTEGVRKVITSVLDKVCNDYVTPPAVVALEVSKISKEQYKADHDAALDRLLPPNGIPPIGISYLVCIGDIDAYRAFDADALLYDIRAGRISCLGAALARIPVKVPQKVRKQIISECDYINYYRLIALRSSVYNRQCHIFCPSSRLARALAAYGLMDTGGVGKSSCRRYWISSHGYDLLYDNFKCKGFAGGSPVDGYAAQSCVSFEDVSDNNCPPYHTMLALTEPHPNGEPTTFAARYHDKTLLASHILIDTNLPPESVCNLYVWGAYHHDASADVLRNTEANNARFGARSAGGIEPWGQILRRLKCAEWYVMDVPDDAITTQADGLEIIDPAKISTDGLLDARKLCVRLAHIDYQPAPDNYSPVPITVTYKRVFADGKDYIQTGYVPDKPIKIPASQPTTSDANHSQPSAKVIQLATHSQFGVGNCPY